jgi:hypothetical protein
MMDFVGPTTISSLREGQPTRRELASDTHPASSIEERFALHPDICAMQTLDQFPSLYCHTPPRADLFSLGAPPSSEDMYATRKEIWIVPLVALRRAPVRCSHFSSSPSATCNIFQIPDGH